MLCRWLPWTKKKARTSSTLSPRTRSNSRCPFFYVEQHYEFFFRNAQIERKHSLISTLIKTAVESDADAASVSVPGVKAHVLKLIVEYMNHHKGVEPNLIEKPLRSKIMKDVCQDPFDAQFIDQIGEDRQLLYDLILGANYMHVNSLLHLGCAKVASLIKGQPLEKIKGILSPHGPVEDEQKQ